MRTPEIHNSSSWTGLSTRVPHLLPVVSRRGANGTRGDGGLDRQETLQGNVTEGKLPLPKLSCQGGKPPADVSYVVKEMKTWLLRNCLSKAAPTRLSCCSSDCGVGNYISASAHPISLSSPRVENNESIIIWAVNCKRRTNWAILSAPRMQRETKRVLVFFLQDIPSREVNFCWKQKEKEPVVSCSRNTTTGKIQLESTELGVGFFLGYIFFLNPSINLFWRLEWIFKRANDVWGQLPIQFNGNFTFKLLSLF